VIDDEASFHDVCRSTLCPAAQGGAIADAGGSVEVRSHGASPIRSSGDAGIAFTMHSADSGQQGLEMLRSAFVRNEPYSVAIVDMRMPGGWDGVETAKRLWQVDPELEIVIASECATQPWTRVLQELGRPSKLLLLRKPCEPAEVWQVVRSLVQKRASESAARGAMMALESANQRLRHEMEARKNAEGRLLFDPLTGLPNRVLLHNQLNACIDRFRRDGERGYAVVFLDLDRFKEINDSLGHDTGDALLVEVSRLLSKMVRTVDTTARDCDLAARLGGDEFVLLLDGLHTADDVRKVTARITTALHEPIQVADQSIRVEMSMGFALGTLEHHTPDDVLRDADAALYHAKKLGRGIVCEFNESIREKVLTRRRLSKELREAVAQHLISIAYQPVFSLDDGDIEGFEALARWMHPELGAISPSLFIPIAEEEAIISDLGMWVLREACRQLHRWQQLKPECADLTMSVNVSHSQMLDTRFVSSVAQVLEEFGIAGNRLALEITESVFVDNIEHTARVLHDLRRLGVRIHLDDFGTGFSSLSMFHRLPVDAVKIDRSFIADMRIDGQVANIVQAIQIMASNRHLKVIAEGIESTDQLLQLQSLGCPCGQGFLLAMPMEADEVPTLLMHGASSRLSFVKALKKRNVA
jgi:diguanylate cyclase (GGDEF)-like protein